MQKKKPPEKDKKEDVPERLNSRRGTYGFHRNQPAVGRIMHQKHLRLHDGSKNWVDKDRIDNIKVCKTPKAFVNSESPKIGYSKTDRNAKSYLKDQKQASPLQPALPQVSVVYCRTIAEKTEDVIDIVDQEVKRVDKDLPITESKETKTSTPKMSKGDLLRMIDFSPISVLSELSSEILSQDATRPDESAGFSLQEEPLPARPDQRMVIGNGSALAVQVDEPLALPFMQESNDQEFYPKL